MSNDMKRITEALSKLEGSNGEYDGDVVDAARTLRRVAVRLPVGSTLANAADAVLANASSHIFRMPANGRIVQAHAVFATDATAAGGNNASINVIEVHANGIIGTTVATQSTNTTANGGTGNISKGVPVALTVTDNANARILQGASVVATVSQNASGVAMGAGSITAVIELEGPIDEAN